MASSSSLSKPSQLPEIPTVSRLSPSIIRILASNPGKFTLQGTNTYLLGSGPRRILLDTGEGRPAWRQSLKEVLTEEKARVTTVLLSHWHGDHVGGVNDVRDIASETEDGGPAPGVWKNQGFEEGVGNDIKDDMVFEVDGARLRARHTPGHTTDHMVFTLESPGQEGNIMFTADNVLGHGTAVFEDLATYMSSLKTMFSIFEGQPFTAYPGHGPVLEDGRSRINEYIKHRQDRENEVVGVMNTLPGTASEVGPGQDAAAGAEWSSIAIVQRVYKDIPESLHSAAERGVLQILAKLRDTGKAEETSNGWRLVQGKERADKL